MRAVATSSAGYATLITRTFGRRGIINIQRAALTIARMIRLLNLGMELTSKNCVLSSTMETSRIGAERSFRTWTKRLDVDYCGTVGWAWRLILGS